MRLFALALLLGPFASACDCGLSGACPSLGSKDTVRFVGTVRTWSGGRWFRSTPVARIRVDEAFGGLPSSSKEIDIHTGFGGGDCGFQFEAGKSYLLDAYVQRDGKLWTSICAATKRIEDAGPELLALRLRRDGKPLPTLMGRILRTPLIPLANVPLRIQKGKSTYRAVSDNQGIYAFYGLPRAPATISAELPEGLALSTRSAPGRESCELLDLWVLPKGSLGEDSRAARK